MTNEEFIKSISLEGEIWKGVVGLEDYYMVSSFGRICALRRVVERKNRSGSPSNYTIMPHINKTFFQKNSPYERIVLFVKKPYRMLVHRIVAQAFIPNPNKYTEVDHINDNPIDNRACNLQWVTPKMNSSKEHHRLQMRLQNLGRIAVNRKPIVMLTTNLEYLKTYPSIKSAEEDGFAHSAISKVISNQRKSHGGYRWMYLSDYEKSLVNQKVKERLPDASGD